MAKLVDGYLFVPDSLGRPCTVRQKLINSIVAAKEGIWILSHGMGPTSHLKLSPEEAKQAMKLLAREDEEVSDG